MQNSNAPRVAGTAWFANKWRQAGWEPDVIVATIERLMAKRDKAPNSPKYFENAIADAHAELARGVPEGSTTGRLRRDRRKSAAEVFLELDDKLNGRIHGQDTSHPDYSAGPGTILDA